VSCQCRHNGLWDAVVQDAVVGKQIAPHVALQIIFREVMKPSQCLADTIGVKRTPWNNMQHQRGVFGVTIAFAGVVVLVTLHLEHHGIEDNPCDEIRFSRGSHVYVTSKIRVECQWSGGSGLLPLLFVSSPEVSLAISSNDKSL